MAFTTRKILSLVVLLASLTPCGALARVNGEAIPGVPFGVARVTVPLPAGGGANAFDPQRFAIADEEGRTFYPAFTPGRIRRLVGGLLGNREEISLDQVTVLFLFTGSEPLRLTVYTPSATTLVLSPRPQVPRVFDRVLKSWWREYSAIARQQIQASDYPPVVETYLTAMLSRRLGLEPPLLTRLMENRRNEARQTFELLLGLEGLRSSALRETTTGVNTIGGTADQPVPPPIDWQPLSVPAVPDDVAIEPIAMHVPSECFYLRFGKFSNYLWLNRLLEDYGGDIGSMITRRGHNAAVNERLQRQLALRQSALAEILGDQVISDVALIGRDTYLQQGAAIGMLFEARNNALLSNDFQGQRAEALRREQAHGATIQSIRISGRDVSLLSTPDNRLRSFYAVDGNYHLVTTSRAIVERFFAAGDGQDVLGTNPEFRHARFVMPQERQDTIFLFFSSAFFRGLVSPQYQIELGRRVRSLADIEAWSLARLAARSEGRPGDTVEDLVRAGLLPAGFGHRVDGSQLASRESEMVDSLRGARGSFLPIPDVPLERVTREEYERYAARGAYYRDNWRTMDPVVVGVRRYALDRQGLERIVIDARVTPLDDSKYDWLTSMLGPPTGQRISSAPGDIVTVQAALRGGILFPDIPPHIMFAGVQDMIPVTDLRPTGLLKFLSILRTTPGYLGAWPQPGFLDKLPFGLAGEPDPFGFSQLPLGVWRRQTPDGFSVVSFDRRMLEQVTPRLSVEETDDVAQVHVRIGDLSVSKLSGWLSDLNYQQARETTGGNTRLLHTLIQQLHVTPSDALNVAEQLLDAELVCSLGGEYQLVEQPADRSAWQSSSLPNPFAYVPPAGYKAPLLEWFRGLESSLTKYDDQLVVHAELDMQRKASEATFQLPLFNLFRGNAQKKPGPEEVEPPTPEGKKKDR